MRAHETEGGGPAPVRARHDASSGPMETERRAGVGLVAPRGREWAPIRPHAVLSLQRLAGNRAVAQVMRQPAADELAAGDASAAGAGEPLVVTDELVPDPGQGPPDTAPRQGYTQQTDAAADSLGGFIDGGMTGTIPFGRSRNPNTPTIRTRSPTAG